MKIKLWLYPERAEYVKKEFKDAIVSDPDEGGLVSVELDLDGSFDALRLFHAGSAYGINSRMKKESATRHINLS